MTLQFHIEENIQSMDQKVPKVSVTSVLQNLFFFLSNCSDACKFIPGQDNTHVKTCVFFIVWK